MRKSPFTEAQRRGLFMEQGLSVKRWIGWIERCAEWEGGGRALLLRPERCDILQAEGEV